MTKSDKMVQFQNPELGQRVILLIETDEQKQSLHHPIRKQILRVLSKGKEDYETQTTTEQKILDDGTGLTHFVEFKRPIRRYWMTVSEIVEELKRMFSDNEITGNQCYYHLDKMREIGLVEQNPPIDYDNKGRKKRIRGMQFRTSARFFISNNPGFSPGNPESCLRLLQNAWRIDPSEEDSEKLTNLIFEQDMALFKSIERVAAHMNESDLDYVTLAVILERLAHVFRSDDDEFIERYRSIKRVLLRSGGFFLESDETASQTDTK